MAINLLPWRETTQLKKGMFILGMMLAASMFSILSISIYRYWPHKHMYRQQEFNEMLQRKIHDLQLIDYPVTLRNYYQKLAVINVIQAIRRQQSLVLYTWGVLLQLMPAGIQITRMQLLDQTMILQGTAVQTQLVMNLLANLQKDSKFEHLLLKHFSQESLSSEKSAEVVTSFEIDLQLAANN